MTMSTNQFNSEGFDLDAAAGSADDVIFEIGGGVTRLEINSSENDDSMKKASSSTEEATEEENSPIKLAEEYKQKGNDAFKERDWSKAKEMYTAAITSTPGMTSEELYKLHQEWKEEQDRQWRKKLEEDELKRREQAEKKRRERQQQRQQQQQHQGSNGRSTTDESLNGACQQSEDSETVDQQEDDETKKKQREEEVKKRATHEAFRAPHHPYSKELAIYHCNRAAVSLHQLEYDDAIRDCDMAILWNPGYVKAYVRRSTAYEQIDKTETALQDAKHALALDPQNTKLQAASRRLQKIEDERLEKLKTETLDKLKELGNSILGNFGLSLDNFQAVQDPNTGSYSINFNQKK